MTNLLVIVWTSNGDVHNFTKYSTFELQIIMKQHRWNYLQYFITLDFVLSGTICGILNLHNFTKIVAMAMNEEIKDSSFLDVKFWFLINYEIIWNNCFDIFVWLKVSWEDFHTDFQLLWIWFGAISRVCVSPHKLSVLLLSVLSGSF